MIATDYSSQVSVMSEICPVPVLKTQNGSGVAAGGTTNSSPSENAQITNELPGTQRRAEYPDGAVGVVANVTHTNDFDGGSMGPTVFDRRRMTPAVAGVAAAAVATPNPTPKPVAVVFDIAT